MRIVSAALILLISGFSFVACNSTEEEPVQPHTKHLNEGQPQFKKEGTLNFLKPDGSAIATIDIEIADNVAEQQQGLMNRSYMRNDQGMLFIFNEERPQSIWMKNTILPLDIIYVGANMKIVSIAENTQPFSEASIPSRGPAQYVVEVNAGYAAQYGLAPGITIDYKRM